MQESYMVMVVIVVICLVKLMKILSILLNTIRQFSFINLLIPGTIGIYVCIYHSNVVTNFRIWAKSMIK